jgi:RimJ/RimL family protein N-acetyltransferase
MSEPRLIFDDKYRVGEWVAEHMPDGASWHDYYAMGAEANGTLVSGIVFENMNGFNANVHIAVSKPTKLFLELLDHAFIYAFETCGLQRLTGLVEADHTKAIHLDLHIGFRVEAVMRGAGSSGQDLLILVLWPENYNRGKRLWEKTKLPLQTTLH